MSTCLHDALKNGLARYERHNPFNGELEFRVEVAPLEQEGFFHLFAWFPQVCFHGDMNGRDLMRRIRTMDVPLSRGWEVLQWQS